MTPRVSSARRPLSAIFIGDTDQETIKQAQLPSPPSTNSQGSGSTADGDSVRDKRRTGMSMGSEDSQIFRPDSRAGHGRRMSSDEDDFENDGDHTAKLSGDRRILAEGTSSYSRASSRIGIRESLGRLDDDAKLNRAHSLAARNRQMLDRLSSPATLARLGTPPPIASRSPIPRPPSSAAQLNGALPRPPSARPKHEIKLSISGSETEREKGVYSSDDHSTPPSSATNARFYDLQERQSESLYSTNDRSMDSNSEASHITEQSEPSSSASHRQTYSSGAGATISRRRGTILLEGSGDGARDPLFAGALAQAVSSGSKATTRTSPHKTRNPLPREFRDRRSYDGRNGGSVSPENPTTSRYRPPSRDRDMPRAASAAYPSRDQFANTPYDSPTVAALASRSAAARSQTVRERRAPSHFRWASEDMHREEDENAVGRGNVTSASKPPTGEPRWRYRTRGGSAESALAAGGRSLVGEGLRAAGLTRRRSIENDDHLRAEFRREDSVKSRLGRDPPPTTAIPPSSSSSSAFSEVSNNAQSLAMRRDRLSRLTGANADETPERPWERDRTVDWSSNPSRDWDHTPDRVPRTPAATSASRFTPTIRNTLSSRPATSMGGPREDYGEIGLRPPPLRTHRSAVDSLSSQPLDRRVAYASPSVIGRERDTLPLPPSIHPTLGRQTPQTLPTEHPRLMLDALQTFENNLNRLPPHSNRHVIPDCINSAQVIVRAADALNEALRTQVARALEEQIEAEVSGGDPELWKNIGADFRESMKQSDEIVRTLTAFLLGVGKVMRDVASASTSAVASRSSAGSASTPSHSRAVSLSAEALASVSGKRSIASGGSDTGVPSRLSADGTSTSSGARRSVDGGRRSMDGYHGDSRDLNGYGESERRDTQPRDWERSPELLQRKQEVPQQAPRRHLTNQAENSPIVGMERSSTSMSTLASRERQNFANSNRPPLPTQGQRLTRRPVTAPQNSRPNGDYDSPTPLSRADALQHQGRRFPPPPLSTLPSESLVSRSATLRVNGSGNGNVASRRKISTGSITTLRGHHHMPSLALPAPRATTQVSTMTVSTATEHETVTRRSQRTPASHNQSFSISSQAVESPVESTEHGQKWRTLSTAPTSDEQYRDLDDDHGYRASNNTQGQNHDYDSVRFRNGRGRTSLEAVARPSDAPTLTDRHRNQRRTTTEPFR